LIDSNLYGWDVSISEDGDIYRQNFKGKKPCPVDELAKKVKEWLLKVPIMADGRESQYFSTNKDYLGYRLVMEVFPRSRIRQVNRRFLNK